MNTTTSETDALRAVLIAAEALLAARENQMVTSEEWDALEHAVAEATQPPAHQREETFTVNESILTRAVTPAPGRGDPYQHTCDLEVYESVAHAIDELRGSSFTYEEIRQRIDAPFTQVAVAIAFLKERCIIVPAHRRRSVASSSSVHLDAMTEWHARREKPEEA
ncbi:MAG: hypothetical protein SYC29_16440 [Planctomycetota bacterium]|nr:hypothetical protein [Planctomycetota bacterium]